VTPHLLSTQAALRTLDRGGNAVDAAIAANAVQGTVAPETCGIGGDLFALVFGPGMTIPVALNSSGRAGSGADAAQLREAGLSVIPQRHPAAVTVPGCVDGWTALHDRWGTLELSVVLEPAIRHARDGFPSSRELAAAFAGRGEELVSEPSAADMYPGGNPPLTGDRIVRRQLAATLAAIADQGRQALYGGSVGAAISEAVDGMITPDDLATGQAEWVDPLSADIFGCTGWTVPPNSQGYISLVALALLEQLGLADPTDPLAWHLSLEAYRVAAADRDVILADPAAMSADPADLTSSERIEGLLADIDRSRVTSLPPPASASGGTAYMCVVDADGLGVSLIQSNFYGIGSGRSVAGAGFLLHDRGRGFTLRAGHPNELRAGRRPLHTLSPTLWTKQGRLEALLGTRGGHNQPQLVIQLATAVMGHHVDPATAMAIPRWATDVPTPGSLDSVVEVEPGTPTGVIEGLENRGHVVRPVDHPQSGWGPMSTILMDGRGLAVGAADPRVDTAAAGTV
jgi:gamma-glutamyltranspeptidase/glutathione hydrolase